MRLQTAGSDRGRQLDEPTVSVGNPIQDRVLTRGEIAMATGDTFYCDKEEAKDDEFGNKVTVVRCHG